MSNGYSVNFAAFESPSESKREFLLLPFGELTTVDDTLTLQFTRDDAADVIAAFKDRGNEMLVDWEHQSIAHLPGFEMFKAPDGRAPAAGWIGGLEIRGDGLWATNVTWADDAQSALKSRSYRYYSPVILHPNNHVKRIYNVALTNEPRLKNLPALAARADLGALLESLTKKESTMGLKESVIAIGALGLQASANDQDVLAAVQKAANDAAQVGPLSAFKTQAETSQAKVTELTAQMQTLTTERDTAKAEVQTKATELSAFKTQVEKDRPLTREEAADLVIDMAEQTGRIAPAQREHYKKLAAMDPKSMLAAFKSQKAGSVVPIGSVTQSGGSGGGGTVSNTPVSPEDHVTALKTTAAMDSDRMARHQKIAKFAADNKISYEEAITRCPA